MWDALDVNRGDRMSKVQAADNPYCAEPRSTKSGRGSSFAAPLATNMNRDYPLSRDGHAHGQYEVGMATGFAPVVSILVRACRALRFGKRITSAPRRWRAVAISRRSADIFVERRKASAGNRSFPHPDGANVQGFSASTAPRAAEARLYGLDGRKRGLKLCR